MTGFMSRTFSMLFLLVVAWVNVCAQDKSLCLSDGKPIHVADPCVFKSGDVYYLTGTSTADKGFEYYTSTDLKNWTRRGMLYEPKGEAYLGSRGENVQRQVLSNFQLLQSQIQESHHMSCSERQTRRRI